MSALRGVQPKIPSGPKVQSEMMSSASSSIFLETLRKAKLEAYHDNLKAFGIDSLQQITLLTMQDYGVVGVSSMEDRKRLYLIQHLKTEADLSNGSTLPAPQPAVTTKIPPVSFLPKPHGPGGIVKPSTSYSTASAFTFDDTDRVRHAATAESRSATPPAPHEDNNSNYLDTVSDSDADIDENAIMERRIKYRKKPPVNSSHSPPNKKSVGGPLLNAYGVPTGFASQTGNKSHPGRSFNDLSERIRVCVRKRPLNKKEIKSNQSDICTVTGRRTLVINEPKVKVDLTKFVEQHEFTFDEVFDTDATNDDVYKRTAFPLVEYVFSGGKATCFAYGQTGSGKTFTMLDEANGLYVMAGRDIFAALKKPENAHLCAHVSFYEIYQSQLYDLLNARKRLYAREDGKQQVCIVGIQEHEVDNVQTLMEIFEFGNNARSTGATGANADSSRSHAIFQIVLKHRKSKKKVQGKLSFIDLAGSERGADRGETDKQTRMEGSEINKSLLALKECIRALDQDSKHTPFRQSKLTQVLKDSFIGNSRTCMVATVSPNIANSEHTLNTLRYAYRVKELKGDGGPAEDWGSRDAENSNDALGPSDEEDNFLLDSEYPPENLLVSEEDLGAVDSDDDDISISSDDSPMSNAHQQRKNNILSQINSRNPQVKKDVVADVAPTTVAHEQVVPTVLPAVVPPSIPPASVIPQVAPPAVPILPPPTSAGLGKTAESLPDSSSSGIDELVNLHRQQLRFFAELSKAESKLLVSFSMKKPGGSERSSMDMYMKELQVILNQKIQSIQEIQRHMDKIKL
ncbi:Kinesin-like protein kif24 [Chytridiales sp. JEL 0842]|nr:Kinesin-like protein kif24 [Chytridiales sp. JEL 0842]